MYKNSEVIDYIAEYYPDSILWDGFNNCVIGIDQEGCVVYDKGLMVDKLITTDNMSTEDAIEYLEYNVFNSYVGEFTPVHITLFPSRSVDSILNQERILY